jgi:uncharacterized protein (TIGR03118 family)
MTCTSGGAGFPPFGIRNINGNLYVTYARQDEDKEDDVAGKGLGVVDVFDANGHFIQRFASGGHLTAPWGFGPGPGGLRQIQQSLAHRQLRGWHHQCL